MKELKYTYALDETKTRLVHIKDARKGEMYYCVNSKCNEQMIVKEGGSKRKHFSHISNGDKCSYDNYLHTLAQKRIVEWFEKGNIEYRIIEERICDNCHNCTWLEEGDELQEECRRIEYASPICLNDVYNKIEKEKKDRNYRWDLYLSNTEKDSTPLAIEIFVTHPCEKPKISYGLPIIEIKIESEEQLDEIISSGIIYENEYITFHNFERQTIYGKTEGIELNKVFLDKKFRIRPVCYEVNCRNYAERQPDSILEVTLDCSLERPEDWNILIGVLAMEYIPEYKSQVCCYYNTYHDIKRNYFCRLLNKACVLKSKNKCDEFRTNFHIIKVCNSVLKNNRHEIWIRDSK